MDNPVGKIMATVAAGTVGFATGWLYFKNQQRAAGCPKYQGSGIPRQGPFKEFSVVYTDRAMNLMSPVFTTCMQDISRVLKKVYNADSLALIPGSGSYSMESVARQFGTDKKVMIIRNGYFSYRWSDIFHVTGCAAEEIVLKAQPTESGDRPFFAPKPIEEVVAQIKEHKPAVVFAPHVETSTGMILEDSYMQAVSEAVHSVGGIFVLDCIASGNIWVDMKANGVDVLISAPQKGWTGPACVGIAMMSSRARALMDKELPATNSFCCNLAKWTTVMEKYEAGGFMYYTTLPTDSLMRFRDVLLETEAYGIEKTKASMWEMGKKVREVLAARGFKSVSAPGNQSPGVVVVYSPLEGMVGKFKDHEMQIAGGVPFKLGEDEFGLNPRKACFRLGLFGLDKLKNIPTVVSTLENALDGILAAGKAKM